MRRNKYIPLMLSVLLGMTLGGCGGSGGTTEQYTVALVAKSTQTEFWLSVFAGAEAAATEYNLELTVVGPETEEDYETQNQMVEEAVRQGADAIVFSAIDFENNAAAIDSAAQQGVRIVAIDSNVDSDQVSTYIGTDNYAAGQMAAQAALDQVEGPLKVGIVNYDISSANGQERERGAADLFADSGRAEIVAVINTLAEAGHAQTDTAALLARYPEINVLVAFNEPTSVGAARAVEEAGRSEDLFLVGFDSNVLTVDGLQEGSVDALIVQNPYAMGYLGVESAYKLLSGQGGVEQTVDTSTKIVDRSNLYTMDSQKALFTFEKHWN
ncbi:substrate-binding domain-containing protein [Flavonifractor plautii]|uniref:substrate-binding domain-containing protein n=1 Tax=Flavonifractor plautii TaxID=292800 RepID=UPI00195B5272|nr:substrate-binding domain-containing protein [Flavonifractor plautii]MBM6664902.1 substrate-binding domain-containing protein [Flavonifractor plautii]